MMKILQRYLINCVALLTMATTAWGQSTCTTIVSGLTFQDPTPNSAGFALSKILIDDNTVYWFDYDAALGAVGGAMNSVPKDGGSVTVLASGLGAVNELTLDNAHIYWTEILPDSGGTGAVKKLAKSGGTVTILAEGTPLGSEFDVFFPQGLALDSDFVYWGEAAAGSAIRRVSKSGGTVVDLGRGENFNPTSITLDENFIYMAEGSSTARILRLPVAGGGTEVLASGFSSSNSILLDEDYLYWVDVVEDGAIFRMPKTGGAVTTLASVSNVHNIAIDDTSVYYERGPLGNEPGTRTILQIPKTGGSPIVAVDCGDSNQGGLISPIYVAVDATSLYVSDTGSAASGVGRVLNLLKEELLPELDLLTNKMDFGPGDLMTVFVEVNNPGIQKMVDFYFGAVLPDGANIGFTDLTFNGGGSLLNLAGLPAIVKGYDLTTPFVLTDQTFLNFNWEGTEPQGNYILFLAIVEAGSLSDNSADPGDIISLATIAISFTP